MKKREVDHSLLDKAKINKKDEFYTQLIDIEKEVVYYTKHFRDKVVYCNCDDPEYSNFWKFFYEHFEELGLKGLNATYFGEDARFYNYDGKEITITQLKENGDFRSNECIRTLDPTRPVSNGICSFWSGLDDAMAKGQDQTQNAATEKEADFWEKQTEAFTNGLDVVGYNYMEDLYERDHELYPERVILGSENFPREIGFRWPVVEKLPYVIGEFTWTAWDYIGEAGIGKSLFVEETDPLAKKGPWAVMPSSTTYYPWRLANDADFDITGIRKPQGDYRSVVWGSEKTYLYSMQPQNYGKAEVISMWGFTDARKCWNYTGFEGKPVEVIAFSGAEEVELLLNGVSVGKKEVQKDGNLPNSVRFVLPYEKGVLEAVSYTDGMEVSRDRLATTGEPAEIRLIPEKKELRADGHDVVFVQIEILDQNGLLVTDAQIPLKAVLSGVGELSGFGSANPVTEDNYTQPETYSFRGRATAVIRSGYEQGSAELVIENAQLGSFRTEIRMLL